MLSTQKFTLASSLALLVTSTLTHAVTPDTDMELVTLSADNLPKGLRVEMVGESCSGCHQIDSSLGSRQASGEWIAVTEQALNISCGRARDE